MYRKGVCILLVCLLVLCLASGCKQNPVQNEQKATVEIPSKVLSIAGMGVEEMCQNMEELSTHSSKNLYCEMVKTSKGGVEVTILERERSEWLKGIEEAYEILMEKSNIEEKGYRVEFAEDFRSFDAYIDRTVTNEDLVYYITIPELNCAYYQLFSGVGAEDWYVKANIYNLETGKILAQGDSNSVLTITQSDWAASEHNSSQIEQKTTVIIPAKVIRIAGQNVDGMSKNMDDLSTISGRQLYREIAQTPDGGVKVTILESERSEWLNGIQKSYDYLMGHSGLAKKGYRVELAPNFESFDTYIDRTVTDVDTMYCFIAPELTCAYYQLFSGVGVEDWYVEINVYNLETGKILVRSNSNSAMTITEADWEASE